MFTGATAQNILKSFGEESKVKKSAVAICYYGNKILLGLAKADDDRDGMWCFVGGGVEDGESTVEAASRELYEESGVVGKPMSLLAVTHPNKPNVSFHIFSTDNDKLTPNEEFTDMKWFLNSEMPTNLYPINRDIIGTLRTILIKTAY